ncbi:hypothetical protein DFH08DRAFT_125780 [Mycena albidolilacea]|uniref:Uncharacterized protein n=1 Tax=Mycena albidolilacea TaxID=1033008 RepID=A0AAD7A5J3_9AGAR|nr:hypothetical protein DFH08DRAFT_125780 [Mycena albidolilacea]
MTSPPPPSHLQLDIPRPGLGCAVSESRLGHDGFWSCCWSTRRLNCGNLGLLMHRPRRRWRCLCHRTRERLRSRRCLHLPFPAPALVLPSLFPTQWSYHHRSYCVSHRYHATWGTTSYYTFTSSSYLLYPSSSSCPSTALALSALSFASTSPKTVFFLCP